MANNENHITEEQAVKKWKVRDKHGHVKKSGSLAVVGSVNVEVDSTGGDHPTADSTYQNGQLGITFHDIKGDRGNGITSIDVEESQVDGGDNIVHIHCTDDEEEEGTQFRVKNGKRGNGIASVTEETSSEDGGINTHIIHYTDPNVPDSAIHTRNGRTGAQGDSAIWDENEPHEKLTDLAHVLGNSTVKPMSQKGVKDAFNSELGEYTENVLEDVEDITVVDNKYYNNLDGGKESSASTYKYIKFPVEVGRKYHVKGAAGQNARLWYLLNASDVKIGNSSDSSAVSVKEEDVTVSNENAAYMIVNTQKSTLDSPVAKVYSETRSLKKTDNAEENNKLPITSNGVAKIFGGLSIKKIIKDVNVPSSERTITNGFFSSNGSPSSTSTAGWTWTRISVNPGEEYTVTSAAGQLARLWLVLNENDTIIKMHNYSDLPIVQTDKVTIPANGVYLIVNRNTSKYGEPLITTEEMVAIDGIDDTPTENSGKLILSGGVFRAIANINGNKGNILFGKTLCAAGDSITFGADMDQEGFMENFGITFYQWNSSSFQQVTENARMSYGFQIAERNNMVFYNQGISGSTVQAISGKNGFSAENGRYTKLPDNIDYLVLFFGWNDAAYGTLGTIEDNDNQSFYGAYNVVLPYLIDKYPYTKICLVVPFGTTEGHRNAVRLLANKWGVACFDFYGAGTPLYYGKEDSVGVDASIVTANRAKFQANGAHPNHYGHKQLSDMLEGFLRII